MRSRIPAGPPERLPFYVRIAVIALAALGPALIVVMVVYSQRGEHVSRPEGTQWSVVSEVEGAAAPVSDDKWSRRGADADNLDVYAQRAFRFDPAFFEPKKKPRQGDWLAQHREPGQTFAQYIRSRPPGRTKERTTIYIQPLGDMDEEGLRRMDVLRQYTAAFFMLPVQVELPVALPTRNMRPRDGYGMQWRQYHTVTIMNDTLLPARPESAICYLGVTREDLYPKPSWNFVFGQANLRSRVGVYSLYRYADADETVEKQRACAVLAHEAGHMFGMYHCIENECIMNGSNSLPELDRQVMMLCPSCLRKLQWNIGFDVLERYRRLEQFYRKHQLPQAEWMARRISSLTQEDAGEADDGSAAEPDGPAEGQVSRLQGTP